MLTNGFRDREQVDDQPYAKDAEKQTEEAGNDCGAFDLILRSGGRYADAAKGQANNSDDAED